jgi:hypothetical protein
MNKLQNNLRSIFIKAVKSNNDEAIDVLKMCKFSDCDDVESLIWELLCEDVELKFISALLDEFLNTRETSHSHRHWVHSLNHFTKELWRLGLYEWVKKFNKIVFQKAEENGNYDYCETFINEFGKCSKWSDDPADFFLTTESVKSRLKTERGSFAQERIKMGRFVSEAGFLKWRLEALKSQILIEDNPYQKKWLEEALQKAVKGEDICTFEKPFRL